MRGRINWKSGLTGIAIILAIATFLQILPGLMPYGAPRSYEGLLIVPRQGLNYAFFESRELVIENQRSQKQGYSREERICLNPDTSYRPFRSALAQIPTDEYGTRLLWVRFVAKPRHTTGACMNWGNPRPRKKRWGPYLKIVRIERIRALPCGQIQFQRSGLRCPGEVSPLSR